MYNEVDYKQVGKRIKSARRLVKMTQANLAEMTDLHDTFISYIETGKKKASLRSLVRIIMVLETSLDYIIFGEERQL
ncbi:MAG: helix-turn-helix domain-containing protein [Oscillospiraceae bacterium]|nr:helix-turn-helix domain-containing protein [Oscillospiraceae bacterium]